MKLNSLRSWILALLALVFLISSQPLKAKEGLPLPTGKSGSTYSHFLNALLLERYGEFNQALYEYNRTLELDPSATIIYRQRASLHLKMGDPEKALTDAQSYLKTHPNDVDSLLLLSTIHIFLNQKTAAQLVLEKILKDHPENPDALLSIAALLMADDSKKAAEYFERYVTVQPDAVEGYYNLGLIYQKLGDDKKAKEMFQKVIDIDNGALPSLILLGQMSEKDGDIETATKYYERALEKMPDNFPLRMQLVLIYSQTRSFDKIGNLLEMFKGKAATAPLEANLWLGIVYESKKDFKNALLHYTQAQKQSNLMELNIRLASMYSQLGETEKALKMLEQTVKKFPDNAQFHYFLGLAYQDVKKPRKAIESFEKAIVLKKDFSSAYFQLGVALDTLKHWDEAEKMFRQAIQIDTSNASAYNYLGYTYADRNEHLMEAHKFIERALEIDQQNPAYLDSLGWLLFREGHLKEALNQLQTASEQLADPVIFEHLGDCHRAMEHWPDAALSYSKSLEMEGKSKTARKKLDELNHRMVPTAPGRKMLKQFEYNLSRASNISGMLTLSAKAKFLPVSLGGNTRGVFYLRKNDSVESATGTLPTELRIDLLDYLLLPAVTLRFHSQPQSRYSIYPPEFKNQMPEETETILEMITSLLNGKTLREFDNDTTRISEHWGSFVFTDGDRSITLDKKGALIREIAFGNRILKIEKFMDVEGVSLPEKISVRWKNQSAEGQWKERELEIEFSHLSLKKIENKIFEIGKETVAP